MALFLQDTPSDTDQLLDFHEETLSPQNLTMRPCHFAHEDSDENDPPQCAEEVQEATLSCAHSADKHLRDAINDLSSVSIITRDRAAEMLKTLNNQARPLLQIDTRAISEYEKRGRLSDESCDEELAIIATKDGLRNELLTAIQRYRKERS